MGLASWVPYEGSTFPITGGSAGPAIASGGGNLNTHRLICPNDTLVVQRKFDFSVVEPKPLVSAPNGYTQGRRSVFFRFPLLLDNGNYTTNTAQLQISADIETTDAEMRAIMDLILQTLTHAPVEPFWYDMSVA